MLMPKHYSDAHCMNILMCVEHGVAGSQLFQFEIASSDMFCTWKNRCVAGQAILLPKLDGGITGSWGERLQVFTQLSQSEKSRIKIRALCANIAYIPINKQRSHWLFARVDFQTTEILLVDSFGVSRDEAQSGFHCDWGQKSQRVCESR